MSSVLRHGWANPQKNPLRGAVLGSALHKAIEKITDEPDTQKVFGREFGQAMANAMPACYLEIVTGLKQRGIKPTDLAMRPADEFSALPAGSLRRRRQRLRGGAQGLGDVVARSDRARSGRAGASLGELDRRRLPRQRTRCRKASILKAPRRCSTAWIRGGLPGSGWRARGGRAVPARREPPRRPRPTPSWDEAAASPQRRRELPGQVRRAAARHRLRLVHQRRGRRLRRRRREPAFRSACR